MSGALSRDDIISRPSISSEADLKPFERWFYWITLLVFVPLIIYYQRKLLNFQVWNDESETIVAAKMMASGKKLYSEVFNHHGPLTFLSGYILELFHSAKVQGHRVVIALMQWGMLWSLYKSPLIKSKVMKVTYVSFAASAMLLYLPINFGHMYKYQVICGICVTIILAIYTLPVIGRVKSLSSASIVIGNILIVSLIFIAVTYAPSALFLFLASFKKEKAKLATIGILSGLLLNVLYLLVAVSIPGYMAYHFYLNANVLSQFSGNPSARAYIVTAFQAFLNSPFSYYYAPVFLVSSVGMWVRERKYLPWRSLLTASALGGFLIRGPEFHALPYYYSCLALPLALFAFLPSRRLLLAICVPGLVYFVYKIALINPADYKFMKDNRVPGSTDFGELVQFLTNKDDKIIAYTFQNFQYIAADRLPVSAHFFYLPPQAKYNEHPKYGVFSDPCEEIRAYMPKVMLVDKWKVWDTYTWESYAGCIQAIIDVHYRQIPTVPYWVRNDIYALQGVGNGVNPWDPALIHEKLKAKVKR